MKKDNLLKFSKGNAKLDKTIFSLSLPAGHSCPFAMDCLAKAERVTGKLTEGKNNKFRCFSATSENIFTKTRQQRWHNFDLLRKLDEQGMINLIHNSIPKQATKIRIHVSGDFFSQKYFNAWLEVAKQNPDRLFYAYTKSLQYWVARINDIPSNFVLTASKGGKLDNLIKEHNLRFAEVVYTIEKAEELGLEIDHDDSHAMKQGKSFALLIHGTQSPKSEASKALTENRKNGIMGYNKKLNKRVITNKEYTLAA